MLSERLRSWTRNPLGSARVGSNPAHVERDLHPPLAQLAERWTVAVYTQIRSIGHRFDSGKPEIETGRVERHSIPVLGDLKLQGKWDSQAPIRLGLLLAGDLSMNSRASISVLLQHRRLLFELNV